MNEQLQAVNTQSILKIYKGFCEELSLNPHPDFVEYLESPQEEQEMLQLEVHGNSKLNFKNRLHDKDIMPIYKSLLDVSPSMILIDLRYNRISDLGAQMLSELIIRCHNLAILDLSGNEIELKGTEYLTNALKNCKNLQSLNLNGNRIQTEGAMRISELLFTHIKLLHLNLGNNEIDHDGMIAVSSVLNCSNYMLEVLNVDNPRYVSVGVECPTHFGKMLANNDTLEKISLRKHKLTCEGITIIAQHLMENKRLRVLDLNCNQIAFQGFEALAKFLANEDCKLQALHVANNKACDYGAKAIAAGIARNTSLIHIDLCYNDINDWGLTYFAQSMMENQTLKSFKLFGNHFGQDSLSLFYKLFSEPEQIEYYPDFIISIVDDEFQAAIYETALDADIYV